MQIPEWIEELSPISVKVWFTEEHWAVLETMKASDHMRLEKVKDKMGNTEFSALMVEASVVGWSFMKDEEHPVPIPREVSPAKRKDEIWEHIPTRWFQRMSMAAAALMDPGDDRLGGVSYEVFRRDAKG